MDFLNSNAFEKMAREYNRKYSNKTVGVLSNENDILVNGTRNMFCNILNFLGYLEHTFKRYKQFNNFFAKSDILKNDLKDFYKNNFNENLTVNWEENRKVVNHKFCALSMLNTYIDVFKLNIDVIQEIDKIKNFLYQNTFTNECSLENKDENYIINKDIENKTSLYNNQQCNFQDENASFYEFTYENDSNKMLENNEIVNKNSYNTKDCVNSNNISNVNCYNDGRSFAKEKEKFEFLLTKLYELQEIFKIFTENLKEFYTNIN